jgi:hypothetical protein
MELVVAVAVVCEVGKEPKFCEGKIFLGNLGKYMLEYKHTLLYPKGCWLDTEV